MLDPAFLRELDQAVAARGKGWRVRHTAEDPNDQREPGYYLERKRMVQHPWGKQAEWEADPARVFDSLQDLADYLGVHDV